jgi:hypothetical protein
VVATDDTDIPGVALNGVLESNWKTVLAADVPGAKLIVMVSVAASRLMPAVGVETKTEALDIEPTPAYVKLTSVSAVDPEMLNRVVTSVPARACAVSAAPASSARTGMSHFDRFFIDSLSK